MSSNSDEFDRLTEEHFMLLLKIASGMRDRHSWDSYPERSRLFMDLNNLRLYETNDETGVNFRRFLTEKGKQWLENYRQKNAPCS